MRRTYVLNRLLGLILLAGACSDENKQPAYTSWKVAGGSKEVNHYSGLQQIDTANVDKLQLAWTYHTKDADSVHSSQIQCNPIIVDGVLYGTSPRMKLFALDAATGAEKWIFDPADTTGGRKVNLNMNNNRGVTYWSEGAEKRIFYTAGSSIYAVDANTGKNITSFGNDGQVDLHEGLGRDVKDLFMTSSSPGIIYKDLLIMGSRVDEGAAAAPGHLRAYDVRTGAQKWIFHTIPQPGEPGYETWEDSIAYKNIGGANAWAGFSLDEKRGILFAPIGSASFDFYGGRRKGSNLYADCVLALDAATGKRIWHFQMLHHDIFDYDPSSAPVLVTVKHDGKDIDAVAQTTKTGFVFLLNRETGKPLFPVTETRVPDSSDLAGEKVWPTQPVPSLPKPFVRQTFNEADINNLVPDSSFQDVKLRLSKLKTGRMFTPASKQGTVIFPGFDGGAEWGGPAFDPESGLIYVNANEMAWILTMVDVKKSVVKQENYLEAGKRLYSQNCMSCHGPERQGGGNYPSLVGVSSRYNMADFEQLVQGGRRMMPAFKRLNKQELQSLASYVLDVKSKQLDKFQSSEQPVDSFRNLPYTTTGYQKFLTKEGYPAIKPPWGTLNAINLNTGRIAWKIALGEYPELVKKGFPVTGTENYGGPVVTSGGLVFIAATRDSKFRAFNKSTGKLLWQTELPAPGFATPATFEVKGKQYVVIACGGGKLGTKSGDAYMAFALPGK